MEILSALEHHRAGRLAEAVEIYTRILQADPDHADALHLLGNAACQLGDADLAVALISRATALFPGRTSYLASLGMAYQAKKRFDQAMSCYARMLELEPDSASACFGIGNTVLAQGRQDEAAESFSRALRLDPGFIEARYNLACLEKSLGRYAQAIENFRIAVDLKPDFADAFHNMGGAFYAWGKLDEAMDSYERASWANLPETHNNIGNIHFDRGQFDQALACYRRAIAAKADYAEAHNNMGCTLHKLGRLEEAAAAFAEAIRLLPAYALAHLNLGDLLMAQALVGDAASHYEAGISIAPGMAEAHFKLGVARSRQKDLPAAAGCFARAVACRPGYLDAIYNMGVVHGQLNRPAEAERYYRQALDLDPDFVNAHINLSSILIEDGRAAEAKRHIDAAYSRQNVFEKPSASADRSVLILLDAGKGNLNLTHLFSEKTNSIVEWMIEYAADDQAVTLPRYDLVFNAMGDPDMTGDVFRPLGRFLETCARPLLNRPDRVARTARNTLPVLLEGIDDLLVPAVWRFAAGGEWAELLVDRLPLLIRPVHTHGGVGLMLARSPGELLQCAAAQSGPVYVSRFIDYRSADLLFRKYRIIFIDRQPYPYHLAISQNWMAHYYTAEMESSPWKLEEEQAFLQDPEAVLGCAGMQAIRAIGARMDLDYAGIDFSIMTDGRVLVFEANPAMLVHPETSPGPLEHKNPYVQRIFDAFEAMLQRSAPAAGKLRAP